MICCHQVLLKHETEAINATSHILSIIIIQEHNMMSYIYYSECKGTFVLLWVLKGYFGDITFVLLRMQCLVDSSQASMSIKLQLLTYKFLIYSHLKSFVVVFTENA